MRRGMLMTVLQQYAQEQDVWRGKTGERCARFTIAPVLCALFSVAVFVRDSIPPLTGAIPADEKHKCKPEDQVRKHTHTHTRTHTHTHTHTIAGVSEGKDRGWG